MWKLIFNGLISELSQKQRDIWTVTKTTWYLNCHTKKKTQQSNIIIALLTPPSFISSLTYWTSSLLSWFCKHVDYVQSLLFSLKLLHQRPLAKLLNIQLLIACCYRIRQKLTDFIFIMSGLKHLCSSCIVCRCISNVKNHQ